MLTILNKLNSPQTVHTAAGPVILPANGEATAEALHPSYDALYRTSRFIEVVDGAMPPKKRGRASKAADK